MTEDFEFERTFLLDGVPAVAAEDPSPDLIVQSYLLSADGYAVRVRIQADAAPEGVRELSPAGLIDAVAQEVSIATLTAKGPSTGGTRYEAERELDPLVATQLVLRGGHLVTKVRHSVWLGEDGWVIDEFLGANAPLVLAEVERGAPVVDLAIPDFCVTEVSDDPRFRNEHLANEPYDTWAAAYRRELAVVGPQFLHTLGRNRLAPS